jgi:hypothetical protein
MKLVRKYDISEFGDIGIAQFCCIVFYSSVSIPTTGKPSWNAGIVLLPKAALSAKRVACACFDSCLAREASGVRSFVNVVVSYGKKPGISSKKRER